MAPFISHEHLPPLPLFTFVFIKIDSPEKWRENMEMALEMFKAQKAMMQQEGAGDEIDGVADVDDLDDE